MSFDLLRQRKAITQLAALAEGLAQEPLEEDEILFMREIVDSLITLLLSVVFLHESHAPEEQVLREYEGQLKLIGRLRETLSNLECTLSPPPN